MCCVTAILVSDVVAVFSNELLNSGFYLADRTEEAGSHQVVLGKWSGCLK